MSEAKGPYFEKEDYSVHSMNAAYAEGFKAGRASRDGLRKALEKIAGEDYRGNRPVSASIAMKALKDDGEVK